MRLWKDGVPEYVQLQVLHLLGVTGKRAADVAVLICGQELQVHRIERDDQMIGQLIALQRAFWDQVEAPVSASPTDSYVDTVRAVLGQCMIDPKVDLRMRCPEGVQAARQPPRAKRRCDLHGHSLLLRTRVAQIAQIGLDLPKARRHGGESAAPLPRSAPRGGGCAQIAACPVLPRPGR